MLVCLQSVRNVLVCWNLVKGVFCVEDADTVSADRIVARGTWNALVETPRSTSHDPRMKQATDGTESWGKVQVFTGNGKGKTTAALGTGLRAYAQGRRVVFVYFDKGGSHYSERKLLEQLRIEYHGTGLDRIDPQSGKFRFGVTDEDKAEAQKGLAKTAELMGQSDLDVLVLDELCVTVGLGALTLEQVLPVLKQKPEKLELILTGRDCPQEIIDIADLVTEMTIVKHYFYDQIPARYGLDY